MVNFILTLVLIVVAVWSLILMLVHLRKYQAAPVGSVEQDRHIDRQTSATLVMVVTMFGLGLLAFDRGDVSTGLFSLAGAAAMFGVAILGKRRHSEAQVARLKATGSAYVPPVENPYLPAGAAHNDRA